jgi:hypothetical protein
VLFKTSFKETFYGRKTKIKNFLFITFNFKSIFCFACFTGAAANSAKAFLKEKIFPLEHLTLKSISHR